MDRKLITFAAFPLLLWQAWMYCDADTLFTVVDFVQAWPWQLRMGWIGLVIWMVLIFRPQVTEALERLTVLSLVLSVVMPSIFSRISPLVGCVLVGDVGFITWWLIEQLVHRSTPAQLPQPQPVQPQEVGPEPQPQPVHPQEVGPEPQPPQQPQPQPPQPQQPQQCCICIETVNNTTPCPTQKHYLCHDDLNQYIETEATHEELLVRYPTQFAPLCPADKSCGAFSINTLRMQLTDKAFNQLMQAQMRLLEHRIAKDVTANAKREQQAQAVNHPMIMSVRHIVENILTLKCPQCKTAFVDFDGCMALNCAVCRCTFCGICLQSQPKITHHAHVASCPERTPPLGADLLFTTNQNYQQHQQLRKGQLLENYLRTLDSNLRRAVEAALPQWQ